jgi:hypothetical protein
MKFQITQTPTQKPYQVYIKQKKNHIKFVSISIKIKTKIKANLNYIDRVIKVKIKNQSKSHLSL